MYFARLTFHRTNNEVKSPCKSYGKRSVRRAALEEQNAKLYCTFGREVLYILFFIYVNTLGFFILYIIIIFFINNSSFYILFIFFTYLLDFFFNKIKSNIMSSLIKVKRNIITYVAICCYDVIRNDCY